MPCGLQLVSCVTADTQLQLVYAHTHSKLVRSHCMQLLTCLFQYHTTNFIPVRQVQHVAALPSYGSDQFSTLQIDPLRRFYSTLREQRPDSEMAKKWSVLLSVAASFEDSVVL